MFYMYVLLAVICLSDCMYVLGLVVRYSWAYPGFCLLPPKSWRPFFSRRPRNTG